MNLRISQFFGLRGYFNFHNYENVGFLVPVKCDFILNVSSMFIHHIYCLASLIWS